MSQPRTHKSLPSDRWAVAGLNRRWTWTPAVQVTDSAGVSALSPGAVAVDVVAAVAASDSAPEGLWAAATAGLHRTGRSDPAAAAERPPSRCWRPHVPEVAGPPWTSGDAVPATCRSCCKWPPAWLEGMATASFPKMRRSHTKKMGSE